MTIQPNMLFQGLSRDEIDDIIAPLPRCHLAAGDVLFHEGDTGASLYLVVSGIIEIYTTRAS
ncbi:MAG TPA: cyclic nucleotide-binding domain-containing protein, partial [Thermomicrobiales bacterium]|nr:cyclic nucleotide-binding domain-containing protein [Thermomicrobiales bacterium]